jgi:hypothetical protein
VELTRVPVDPGAPRKIATLPYSALPASGSATVTASAALVRGARSRTVLIQNTMDEATAAATVTLYDSTVTGNGSGLTAELGACAAGAVTGATSEMSGSLAAHVDSLSLTVTMGATAATSGNVNILVAEVF